MTHQDSISCDFSSCAGPVWIGHEIAARIARSAIVIAHRTPGRDVEGEILRWIAAHGNGRNPPAH